MQQKGRKTPFSFKDLQALEGIYWGLKNMNVLNNQTAISKELLIKMQQLFPNQLPLNLDVTPQDIAYLQGQQSVIQKLEGLYQENEEE